MNTTLHKTVALLFPVLVAVLLTGFISPRPESMDERLQLQRIDASSAAQLAATFERLGYHWPPQGGVPPVEVTSLPSDLNEVRDVEQKKSLFFRALLPIVLAENEKLAGLRSQVVELLDKGVADLTNSEHSWLQAIATQYRIKTGLDSKAAQQRLLRRVDVVPPALVLAQAANESAWGTSRFARQGNNLFGQWTYQESKGIVPLGRPEGASYAVRAFATVDASVRAYLRNLNTNAAYRELRRLRAQMRRAGQPLDAHRLATGLHAYSARGEEYIEELQVMMRGNRLLSLLDSVSLSRPAESTAG